MKQYSLTMNYVQGCVCNTFCSPPICAKDIETAVEIANDMIKKMYGSVVHVSLHSINSAIDVLNS